jgi:hypothetical protein
MVRPVPEGAITAQVINGLLTVMRDHDGVEHSGFLKSATKQEDVVGIIFGD